MSARRRPWLHLALIAAGLVAGVLILEATLRIAAFVASRWTVAESPTAPEASTRILALGDSNTFGLYVGRENAYPHQLEAQWNARADRRRIAVVNAGHPGNGSSQVREQLGRLLATHRPEIVTVMIGGNDYWREPASLEDASVQACVERARKPVAPQEKQPHREWRIVRALRLLSTPPALHFFPELPPRRAVDDPRWPTALADNLRAIVACIRQTGGRPLLLTYPSSFGSYNMANEAMRAFAGAENVPLLDLARRFDERCPHHDCEYLFPEPDQHPTAAGHAWIAEVLDVALAPVPPPAQRRE